MSHTKKKKHSHNKKKQTSQSKENRESRSREKKSERNKDKDKKYKKRPISGGSNRTKSRSESYDKSSSESASSRSRSSSSSSSTSSISSTSSSNSNDSLVSRNKRHSRNEEKRKKRDNVHKCSEKKKKKRNRSISKNKKEKCHKCKSRSKKRKKRCNSKDNRKMNLDVVDNKDAGISDKKVAKSLKSAKKSKKRKNSTKENIEHEPKTKTIEDIKLGTSLTNYQSEPEKPDNSTKSKNNDIESDIAESANLQNSDSNLVIKTIDTNLNVEVKAENESKTSDLSKLCEKEKTLVATPKLKKKSRKSDTTLEVRTKNESFERVCSSEKNDNCLLSEESTQIENNLVSFSDLGQQSCSEAPRNTLSVRKDLFTEGDKVFCESHSSLHDAKELEKTHKAMNEKPSKKKKSKKHKVKESMVNSKTLVPIDAIVKKSIQTSENESTNNGINFEQCAVKQGIISQTIVGNIEVCSEKQPILAETETECVSKHLSTFNIGNTELQNSELDTKSHRSQRAENILSCKLIPEERNFQKEEGNVIIKGSAKEWNENANSRKEACSAKKDRTDSKFVCDVDEASQNANSIINENISAQISHSSKILSPPYQMIPSPKLPESGSYSKEIITLKETDDKINITPAKSQTVDLSKNNSLLTADEQLALEQCKVEIGLPISVKTKVDNMSGQIILKPLEQVEGNSGNQLNQCPKSKSKWESVSSSADICRESTNNSDSVQESQISSTIKHTSHERSCSRSRSRSASYVSETNAKQLSKNCADGLKRTRSSSRTRDKKRMKTRSRSKSDSRRCGSESKRRSRSKSQSQQRSSSTSKQNERSDNKQTSPVLRQRKERSRSNSEFRSGSPTKCRSESQNRSKSSSRYRSVSKTRQTSISRDGQKSRSASRKRTKSCSRSRSQSQASHKDKDTKQSSGSKKKHRSRSKSKLSKSKHKSRSNSNNRSGSNSKGRCVNVSKCRSTSHTKHTSKSHTTGRSRSHSKHRTSRHRTRSRSKHRFRSRSRSRSHSKRRSSSQSRRRSTSRSRRKSNSHSRRRSTSWGRHRSTSRSRRKSPSRSRQRSSSRNRRRSTSRRRRRSTSRSRRRSVSRGRHRSSSRGRRRSTSRSRHRSTSRSRRRSTTPIRRGSKSRRRSLSRRRNRSRSRRRSTSRSRRKSRSRSRRKSRSRSKRKSRSRSRRKSTSRSRHKSRSRSRRKSTSRSRRKSTSRSRRKSTSRSRRKSTSRSRRKSSSLSRHRSRSQSKHRSRSTSKHNSSSTSRHKKEGSRPRSNSPKGDLTSGNKNLEHERKRESSLPKESSMSKSISNVKNGNDELYNNGDLEVSRCSEAITVHENSSTLQVENMSNSESRSINVNLENEVGNKNLSDGFVLSSKPEISLNPELKEQEIEKCISCQLKNMCNCSNVRIEKPQESGEANAISVGKQNENEQVSLPETEVIPATENTQTNVNFLSENNNDLGLISDLHKSKKFDNLATELKVLHEMNSFPLGDNINKKIENTVSDLIHNFKKDSHKLNIVAVKLEENEEKTEQCLTDEPSFKAKLSNSYDTSLLGLVDGSNKSINYEPLTNMNDSMELETSKIELKSADFSTSPCEFHQMENTNENKMCSESIIKGDNCGDVQIRNTVSLICDSEQTKSLLDSGLENSAVHRSSSNESFNLEDQLCVRSVEENISESKHNSNINDSDQTECKITFDSHEIVSNCNSESFGLNLEDPTVDVKQENCMPIKDEGLDKESIEQKCEKQDDCGTIFKKSNNEPKTVREKKKAKHRSRSHSKERKSKKRRAKSKETSLIRHRSRSESKDRKRISHEKKVEKSKNKKKKNDNKEKESIETKEYKVAESNQDSTKNISLRSRSQSKEKSQKKSPEKTSKDSKNKEDKPPSSEKSVKLRSKSRSKSHSKERKSGIRNSKERNRSRSKENKKRKARSRSTEERKRRRRRRSRSHPASQEKIDKKKLLEIAQRNAMAMMKQEVVMSSVISKGKLIVIEKSGKSVAELTDFCKKLSEKEAKSQQHSSQSDDSPSDSDSDLERPYHHPFQLKQQPLPGFSSGKTGQKDKQLTEPPKLLAIQYPTVLKKTGSVSQESQQNQCQIIKSDWVPVSPQVPDTPAPNVPEIKRVSDTPKEEINTIGTEKIKFVQPIKIVTKSSNEGTPSEPETVQRDVNFRWLKSTTKRIQ